MRNWCWIVGLALLSVAGCSDGRKMARVSGRVTLDGRPVEQISVFFQPVASPGANRMNVGMASAATTDADGRFELQFIDNQETGAMIGRHTVTLNDMLAERASDEAPTGKRQRSRIPLGWAKAEHSFVVPDQGTTEANFELNVN